MLVVALLGLLVNLSIGIGLGARLLWVARRTREIPEFSIGASSLGVSLGAIGLVAAQRTSGAEGEPQFAAYLLGMTLVGAGSAALAVGVWRIFQPKSAVARGAAVMAAAVQGTSLLICVVNGAAPLPGDPAVGQLLGLFGRVAVYAWGAVECLRYHGMLRRRLRLGLADPMIAHQILLWGVSATSMTATLLVLAYSNLVLGQQGLVSASVLAVTIPLGLTSSLGIWFAFFPPGFYQRLVEARAVRSQV